MTRVCECGKEARAGDVECSLCGRDLGTRAPAGAWTQTPLPPGPGGPPPPATSGPPPPATTGPRPMFIVVVALLLAVALSLLIFVLIRPENAVVVPPAATGQPTESQVAPAEEVPPPSTPFPSAIPSEPEPSGEYSLLDPPLAADEQPVRTKVVRDSPGTACRTAETKTVYGGTRSRTATCGRRPPAGKPARARRRGRSAWPANSTLARTTRPTRGISPTPGGSGPDPVQEPGTGFPRPQ